MPNQRLSFFQPRDLGEVIYFTFKFIGKNFVSFFLIIFLSHLPIALLIYWFVQSFFPIGFLSYFLSLLGISVVEFFIVAFIIGFIVLLVYAYSVGISLNYCLLYENNHSQPPKIFAVVQATFQNYYRIFVTYAVYNLFFFGIYVLDTFLQVLVMRMGLFMYIIWSLLFFVLTIFIDNKLCLMGAVTLKEELSGIQALKKSWELVRGYWWQTFGIRIVIGIATFLIFYFLTIILGLFLKENIWDMVYESWGGLGRGSTIQTMLLFFSLGLFLSYLIFSMLMGTALFAQYGNLTEQKYGTVSLSEKASKIGTQNQEETEDL
ncbi:MAG: hypothetical protein NZ516_00200 [Raineya sp.]|nr:hypothetical protein [Raineya sp.]